MINGLLELAKAEAGRLEVHIEQVNLADAIQAMLALIRPLADQGDVELLSRPPPICRSSRRTRRRSSRSSSTCSATR